MEFRLHYIPVFFILLCQLPFWASTAACGNYKVDLNKNVYENKRLMNHEILNVTVSRRYLCMTKCSEHCLCESFNICEKGKKCQLSSSTQGKSTDDFADNLECTYYDMERELPSESHCLASASGGGSENDFCCRYSNPCLNDGVCIGYCPDTGKRFECRCKPEFYGDRCQNKRMTCQDYWTTPKPSNGVYNLHSEAGNIYKAFCDFNSEEGIAWTLVLSFSREVVVRPLHSDFPAKNVDSPETNVHWSDYSLAKPTMVKISELSTQWRTTCEFDTRGVDYVDYMRGKIVETDIMNYDSAIIAEADRCRLVEFVNIRGKTCESCTVALHQAAIFFHSEQTLFEKYGCDLNLQEFNGECSSGKELYFGSLQTRSGICHTGNHRCAATADSTGQIWFGGKKN